MLVCQCPCTNNFNPVICSVFPFVFFHMFKENVLQAVNGIENLIATVEAMSMGWKPDGKLAELLADLQAQRTQHKGDGGTCPLYKY